MPPRPGPQSPSLSALVPTYDFTGRRVRYLPPPPGKPELEPSPLLAAIRAYLERA